MMKGLIASFANGPWSSASGPVPKSPVVDSSRNVAIGSPAVFGAMWWQAAQLTPSRASAPYLKLGSSTFV